MTMKLRTAEQYAIDDLRRGIESVATDLEYLAEKVRKLASAIDTAERTGDTYADVPRRVQHTVLSAIPNLSLAALIQYAAQADIARERGQ